MQLISRALSPAEVNQVMLNETKGEATVVVAEDQLSKAIGKEGKNVRLAAKLTGWKIDLISSREYNIRQRVAEEVSMTLDEMSGMTPELNAVLEAVGIESIRALVRVDHEALAGLAGVGSEKATELQTTAVATLEELDRVIEETVHAELNRELGEGLLDESLLDEGGAATDETPASPADVVVKDDLFSDFDEKLSDTEDADAGDAASDAASEEESEGDGTLDDGEESDAKEDAAEESDDKSQAE